MVERRERARLALESQDGVAIGGDARRQDLDRDVAAEALSRARYTSPIPPAPSSATISYPPIRVPG